jgi:hypothetical protein
MRHQLTWWVAIMASSLTGCHTMNDCFQRFEAWKTHTLFGHHNTAPAVLPAAYTQPIVYAAPAAQPCAQAAPICQPISCGCENVCSDPCSDPCNSGTVISSGNVISSGTTIGPATGVPTIAPGPATLVPNR